MRIIMDAAEKTSESPVWPELVISPDEPALVCTNICKYFKASLSKDERKPARNGWERAWQAIRPPRKRKTAVGHVKLELKRGEIFGVVGHNGSGKSTLIRIISTLLLADDGDIRVFGYDTVKQPYQVQRLINRVSVDAAFFKKLSANENLLYAARLYGVGDDFALRRAEEILKILGLEEGRMTDSLQELSRGMQQKVAIARSLLSSPILLLLDEPTTGLDPRSKRDVQDFILDLQRTHDATVLWRVAPLLNSSNRSRSGAASASPMVRVLMGTPTAPRNSRWKTCSSN
jgi:ABC-2 type transport system ATP-binding protein